MSTDTDLPEHLAAPARRALVAAGVTRIEHLTGFRETDIRALHGMGPKAIEELQSALAERGMSFATD